VQEKKSSFTGIPRAASRHKNKTMRLPKLCCKNAVNDVHDSDKIGGFQKKTPVSFAGSPPSKEQAPLVANVQQRPTYAPYDEELIRLHRKQELEHSVVNNKGRPRRVKQASHDPNLCRTKDESLAEGCVRRKQISSGYSPDSNAFFAPIYEHDDFAPDHEQNVEVKGRCIEHHPVADYKGRPRRVKHASVDPDMHRKKDESCSSEIGRRKQVSLGLYDYSPESNAFFAPERGGDPEEEGP
jgi:hypothetical protein